MAIIGVSGKISSGKDTIGKIIQYLTSESKDIMSYEEYQISQSQFGYDPKWEIRKFADKLKDIVCLLIGCTREQLEDQDFKNTPLGEHWGAYEITSNHASWINIEAKRVFYTIKDAYVWIDTLVHIENPRLHFGVKEIRLTPRLLLQLIGTECGRNIIHPNIWINALFAEYKPIRGFHERDKSKYDSYPNWIITDTRFPNELEAIKTREGISIRVNRKKVESVIEMMKPYSDFLNYGIPLPEEHPSETSLDNAEFDYVIDNDGTIEELIEKVKEFLITFKII